MTTNLYTFNPFTGVSVGIPLILDGVNPRNNRPVSPHIACGPAFVAIENRWQHPPLDRHGRLREASLHLIEPLSGAKPFEVLVPQHGQEGNIYCFVENTIPRGMKLKVKPEEVRARFAVQLSANVRMVIYDKVTQSYLLEFSADNAEVNIWYETGHIARIVCRGDSIVQIPLTPVEITKERIYQYEEQFLDLKDELEADQKRRHGIIAGALRLLCVTNDCDAENLLVEFLVEQIPYLTERLREQIRFVLLEKRHPLAGNFLPGWTNVVSLRTTQSTSDGKAKALARKRVSSDQDRIARLAAKGSSGGSSQKRGK